jgi:TolB-like protein
MRIWRQVPALITVFESAGTAVMLQRSGARSGPKQGRTTASLWREPVVAEIITALSRIRWLFVIARNSSFTYKGEAVDVKQVGRELGVRDVLEGSVRKAGGRVRITAQLIDALSGPHLWTDRFDGSLEDVFELQDQVAVSVAGVIEPALQSAEMRRSAARPTTDLTSYGARRAIRYGDGWIPTARGPSRSAGSARFRHDKTAL